MRRFPVEMSKYRDFEISMARIEFRGGESIITKAAEKKRGNFGQT